MPVGQKEKASQHLIPLTATFEIAQLQFHGQFRKYNSTGNIGNNSNHLIIYDFGCNLTYRKYSADVVIPVKGSPSSAR